MKIPCRCGKYYKGEKVKKCVNECGRYVEQENLDIGIQLCKKCDEPNWITDSTEIQKEILKDPELKNIINHQSPYGKI